MAPAQGGPPALALDWPGPERAKDLAARAWRRSVPGGHSGAWRRAARGAAAFLAGALFGALPAHPQPQGRAQEQPDSNVQGRPDGVARQQAQAQAPARPDWPAHGPSRLPSAPAPCCRGRAGAAIDEAWRGRHTRAILLGTSVGVAAYGWRNWWQEGFHGHFSTANEAWFGSNTYSGGADKLGHLYMSYAGTRLLTGLLVWDGAEPSHALRTAAFYTLGTLAAIEVLDGFSKTWRFSREDMLMNAVGVGAGVLLERNERLDRLIDLRLRYRPSNGRFDPFGDYSGQTYLVVAKLAGWPAIMQRRGMLRYLEIAAGYGSRGFDTGHAGKGRRHLYVGVSLNLSELLGPAGAEKHERARRVADTALEFVQIPGTIVLAKHTLRR